MLVLPIAPGEKIGRGDLVYVSPTDGLVRKAPGNVPAIERIAFMVPSSAWFPRVTDPQKLCVPVSPAAAIKERQRKRLGIHT